MGVISAFSCYRRSIMPMVSLVALVGGEEGEEHEEVEQRGRAEAGDQHLREAVDAATVAASKRGHQAGGTSGRRGCRGRGPARPLPGCA